MSKVCVAMVCDFFYPKLGGVQVHIEQLTQILSQWFRVIVITHEYNSHKGLIQHQHYRTYYLPLPSDPSTSMTYPTFALSYGLAKQILIQEHVSIIHCHQSCSPLALQFIFYGKMLQLKVILTEHSLIGLNSILEIHYNAVFRMLLPSCDGIIAVSRATRNNIVMRGQLDVGKVRVVPNGVAKPCGAGKDRKKSTDGLIKIIVVGRLTFRRGTDLLIQMLPQMLKIDPDLHLYVVGDGPKFTALSHSITDTPYQSRVHLLGYQPHEKVMELLPQCDIFLNTAITESFGIALVEASAFGLHCVSTNVGGISEVLPQEVLTVVEPSVEELVKGVTKQVELTKKTGREGHQFKNPGYNWDECSKQVKRLYEQILEEPKIRTSNFLASFCSRGLLSVLFLFCFFIGILYSCTFKRKYFTSQSN